MKVLWSATLEEAQKREAECFAQALADGQKCEKWAEIIVDKALGYGVPVKDRVLKALAVDESAKVADYTPAVEALAVSADVLPVR